ncbi:MAG TPA: DUF397 domain-containing protein [Trebonia sp.]|nr:DUF397 domain-containing protein [Trebonia sp.]
MTEQTWRKSSYSGSQANCVEVGRDAGLVLVRDTKDQAGVVLAFAPQSWRRFAAAIKESPRA